MNENKLMMKELMMKMPDIKAMVASRATHSENNTYGKFYKSYISDVSMNHSGVGINGLVERAFTFKYKGKIFEVSEKCTGSFSVRYKFYLKEVSQ